MPPQARPPSPHPTTVPPCASWPDGDCPADQFYALPLDRCVPRCGEGERRSGPACVSSYGERMAADPCELDACQKKGGVWNITRALCMDLDEAADAYFNGAFPANVYARTDAEGITYLGHGQT